MRVWAVPPNANSAYDEDQTTGYASFASHWNGTVLEPGGIYFQSGFGQGDLAYYVPDVGTIMHGVVGLAYIDDSGNVSVVVPPTSWGERLPAEQF
jgi:hypothetical protein